MERRVLSLNVMAVPAIPLETVSQMAVATGNPCETSCQVKACGTDRCPLVSAVKGLTSKLELGSETSKLLQSRELRILSGKSSDSSVAKQESQGHISGGGGTVDSSVYCDTCAKKHSADKVCESKKAA